MQTKTLVVHAWEDSVGDYEIEIEMPVDETGSHYPELLSPEDRLQYGFWQLQERHRQEIAHKYLGAPCPEPEPFDTGDDSLPF